MFDTRKWMRESGLLFCIRTHKVVKKHKHASAHIHICCTNIATIIQKHATLCAPWKRHSTGMLLHAIKCVFITNQTLRLISRDSFALIFTLIATRFRLSFCIDDTHATRCHSESFVVVLKISFKIKKTL